MALLNFIHYFCFLVLPTVYALIFVIIVFNTGLKIGLAINPGKDYLYQLSYNKCYSLAKDKVVLKRKFI